MLTDILLLFIILTFYIGLSEPHKNFIRGNVLITILTKIIDDKYSKNNH